MIVREAIILAAGKGSRLRLYYNLPKPIALVRKVRLFQLPILSLYFAGVKRFIVVTHKHIKKFFSRFLNKIGVEYEIAINSKVGRENGYSLNIGLDYVDEDIFFVSMCDHVFPSDLPRMMLNVMNSDIDILIAGDADPQYIDIDEATKIHVVKGKVIRIGKNLKKFNYIDAGVFIMSKHIFGLVKSVIKTRRVVKVSDIVNRAIESGYNVTVADITGVPWVDVDTANDLKNIVYGEAAGLLDSILERTGDVIGSL
ncbi:MAG: sugar phosphate nucleotidyltransferase [Candidatus Njordarchaeota archaeon]